MNYSQVIDLGESFFIFSLFRKVWYNKKDFLKWIVKLMLQKSKLNDLDFNVE